MKDLEKIKSEDLGCQVADANPGNFAIEQEVAQLVGATVPAPTEPSADDARELGAQLLVFLRRALTPIQSALRTALAAIYAHLDSRCTDYTPAAYASYIPRPYDPMGTPPTPRSVANLLTALTAFAPRKISNGSAPNDGIPDGMSLAHLLCDTDAANAVTEIKDDNYGWTMDEKVAWASKYPSLKKLTLNCTSSTEDIISDNTTVEELNIQYLEAMPTRNAANQFRNLSALKKFEAPSLKTFGVGQSYILCNLAACKSIDLPVANTTWNGLYGGYVNNCPNLEWINMPNWPGITSIYGDGMFNNNPKLERVVWGKITAFTYSYTSAKMFDGCPNLIDLELGQDSNVSIRLADWNPINVLSDADKTATFLQNFREHIALRLTSNGSGKTLTLSQAVRDAIHAAEATYGIEAIIVTQKGWTLSPAPGASSQ